MDSLLIKIASALVVLALGSIWHMNADVAVLMSNMARMETVLKDGSMKIDSNAHSVVELKSRILTVERYLESRGWKRDEWKQQNSQKRGD